MHHAHHVLRGVAIAQTSASADFNERGEARPDHASLSLIEGPDVGHGVEACVGRLALEHSQLLRPVLAQGREGRIHCREVRVFRLDLLAHSAITHSQHEGQPRFFVREQPSAACAVRRNGCRRVPMSRDIRHALPPEDLFPCGSCRGICRAGSRSCPGSKLAVM